MGQREEAGLERMSSGIKVREKMRSGTKVRERMGSGMKERGEDEV